MHSSLLLGLDQATPLDLVLLGVKLLATGGSLGLVAVVLLGAWALRDAGTGARRIYLCFVIGNLLAALFVLADTAVRVGALMAEFEATLQLVRIALVAIMAATSVYLCLYWMLAAPTRPPWPRIAMLCVVMLVVAVLLWVEHPALVIASDRITLRGLSAFPEYGAAAPWYFVALLLLGASVMIGLLRSPLRHSDRTGWRLNLIGMGLLLAAGSHDALRELGVVLLPVAVLWLGVVSFQVGAFGMLALYFARLLREHRQQSVKLRHMSDALARDRATGLFSRSYVQDLLERGGRESRGGLLFIDIDNFKSVNDRYGHFCGDAAIAAVADLLRSGLRGGDIPCRWGGDEFLVYLPGANPAQARELGARLQARARELRIEGAPELRLGLSMGYAELTDGDWRRCAELADQALYQSKRAGRGRLTVAGDAPRAEAV